MRPGFAGLVAVMALLASPATAQFVLVEDFEGLVIGDVAGQGDWSLTSHTSIEVSTDPLDAGNQALSVRTNSSGTAVEAYNSDPDLTIASGATGTLFFRFYTGSPASHLSFGLSDVSTPGLDFADFEAQLRHRNGDLEALDDGARARQLRRLGARDRGLSRRRHGARRR